MKRTLLYIAIFITLGFSIPYFFVFDSQQPITGAPPYDPSDQGVPKNYEYSWIYDWERPEGPAKVGLQVGHWKSDELPEELKKLRNNTGATGGSLSEWEVNYEIAMATKELLEQKEIEVDILPATVPERYWADIFVSIHADGSHNTGKSGFKVAAPRRDMSGKANSLVEKIEETYKEQTGLSLDPNVTRNMRGYYAFSWWRYDHSVHPRTASVILETGFLTNYSDRLLIVSNPEIPASALSDAIISHLESEELL